MTPPDPALAAEDSRALAALQRWLEAQPAEARIDWARDALPGAQVLSSSFGAQSAVSLHLVTQRAGRLPVVLVDTGYLFADTYRFVDRLRERLDLDLRVYRAALSPAWQEARWGRLWERGREGLGRYNRINKTEPMQRALDELGAGTWIAGLRRVQASTRAAAPVLAHREGRWKLHPTVDWSDRDVGRYLARHGLPYHPLWAQGYVSIGDTHTTVRWEPGMRAEDTRFFGLKRECGLHEHP